MWGHRGVAATARGVARGQDERPQGRDRLGGARAAGAAGRRAGGEAGGAGIAAMRGGAAEQALPRPLPQTRGGVRFAGYAAVFDRVDRGGDVVRAEEHTSELQSLMRTSYAVFCWTKKN